MAAWQFDLHCLPEAAVVRRYAGLPLSISVQDWETIEWWKSEETTGVSLLAQLSQLLPKGRSWNLDLQTWGDEEGTRIDVFFANGLMEFAYVRIDVRSVSYNFLVALLEIARANRVVLRTENGYVLRPSFRALKNAISRSPAISFVKDPASFLAKRTDGNSEEVANDHEVPSSPR